MTNSRLDGIMKNQRKLIVANVAAICALATVLGASLVALV